jgi:acetyl-CoA C-acetyltransferase
MPERVAVVGFGVTRFAARHPDATYFELAFDATKEALSDAGLTPNDIDAVVYGVYNDLFERQFMQDVLIHDYLGLYGKPGVRVTTGGSTGGYAFREAYLTVASGLHDIVLCIGAEKCADCFDYVVGKPTPEVVKAIAYSADMTYEFPSGMYAASSYALLARAHMDKYGTTEEQAAKVSVKNHKNAMLNPIAQSPMELTVEEVMKSRMIAYPFKMLDCCLYTEGAAALVLATEKKAKKITDNPVWVKGVGAANDKAFTGFRSTSDKLGKYGDIADLRSHYAAAEAAYRMAGLTDPIRQLDLAEIHDAFSFTELQAYEAMRFCPPGGAGKFIDEGIPEREGELPCTVSGGLIGCGHAVGATGIMQTGEVVMQLREEAGKKQVPIKRGNGLVHSIGGPGSCYCTVAVLGKDKEKERK